VKKIIFLTVSTVFVLAGSAFAQTTIWTDGAGDQLWSSAANWSNNVPTTTGVVEIGTQPTGDQIGIDTGGETTVASFTFNNTLTASVDIAPLASETLKVNGAITNNSAYVNSFSLGVIAGASAVWTGPISFTAASAINSNTITLSNAISMNGLTVDVTSTSASGKFAGAGSLSLSGVLKFNFTTATGAGSWDIASMAPTGSLTSVSLLNNYTASFTESTPGTWTANGVSGLDWTYTESTGVLTAVPEPATWALLAGSLTTIMVFRRRRQP
jgi:hypothetical protein